MRLLFWGTAAYSVVSLLVVLLFRPASNGAFDFIVTSVPGQIAIATAYMVWFPAVIAFSALVVGREGFAERFAKALGALVICSFFYVFFLLFKTSMPSILTFHADPLFAELDKLLHFGFDPAALTYALTPNLPTAVADVLYLNFWVGPALYFPVLLFLFDADSQRTTRFLKIYLFAWAALGSVVALLALSVGPVFYDALYGGSRFGFLADNLKSAGFTDGRMGGIQAYLWQSYIRGESGIGAGISAFPSVHIALVNTWALYLYERAKWLWPIGLALVAFYTYLTVHIGFHYAIDGYASTLAIWAFWYFLKTRDEKRVASGTFNVAQ